MMKDIKGFEGLYAVTEEGQVWSYRRQKFLKPCKNRYGYLCVCLVKNAKRYNKTIHQLVAKAFIPNPNNFIDVNHKDEDKTNNCVDNLEWCDDTYNNNYGTRSKRASLSQINTPSKSHMIICVETGAIYPSKHEAERQLGVNHSSIGRAIKKGICAGGYHWEAAGFDGFIKQE